MTDDGLERIIRDNMIGSKNYERARGELDRRHAKRSEARQLFWIKLTLLVTFVLGVAGIAATLLR